MFLSLDFLKLKLLFLNLYCYKSHDTTSTFFIFLRCFNLSIEYSTTMYCPTWSIIFSLQIFIVLNEYDSNLGVLCCCLPWLKGVTSQPFSFALCYIHSLKALFAWPVAEETFWQECYGLLWVSNLHQALWITAIGGDYFLPLKAIYSSWFCCAWSLSL